MAMCSNLQGLFYFILFSRNEVIFLNLNLIKKCQIITPLFHMTVLNSKPIYTENTNARWQHKTWIDKFLKNFLHSPCLFSSGFVFIFSLQHRKIYALQHKHSQWSQIVLTLLAFVCFSILYIFINCFVSSISLLGIANNFYNMNVILRE